MSTRKGPQHLLLSWLFPRRVLPRLAYTINMCTLRKFAMFRKRNTITRIRPGVRLPRTIGNYETKIKGGAASVYLRLRDLSLFSHDSLRLDEKVTCVDSQCYTIRPAVCGQVYEALENARSNHANKTWIYLSTTI